MIAVDYGCFAVAMHDHGRFKKGEIAVVISRAAKQERTDLLFENGKTLFDLEKNLFNQHFRILFSDPDFIVDGCSCSPSWQKARSMISRAD